MASIGFFPFTVETKSETSAALFHTKTQHRPTSSFTTFRLRKSPVFAVFNDSICGFSLRSDRRGGQSWRSSKHVKATGKVSQPEDSLEATINEKSKKVLARQKELLHQIAERRKLVSSIKGSIANPEEEVSYDQRENSLSNLDLPSTSTSNVLKDQSSNFALSSYDASTVKESIVGAKESGNGVPPKRTSINVYSPKQMKDTKSKVQEFLRAAVNRDSKVGGKESGIDIPPKRTSINVDSPKQLKDTDSEAARSTELPSFLTRTSEISSLKDEKHKDLKDSSFQEVTSEATDPPVEEAKPPPLAGANVMNVILVAAECAKKNSAQNPSWSDRCNTEDGQVSMRDKGFIMAYSDDEAESGPTSVSNYYFEDETDQPVSFAVLPIQWSKNESPISDKRRISLRGTADNGLQTIHKDVIAWKFDLTNVIPEISLLSKEKKWIKLLKPRKSFEETIRTILITVHCLSYSKRNPEASEKSLWDHMSRTFSLYEVRPSQNDLVDHMDLIGEALKRDDSLAKSKFLVHFLEEKPRKRKISDQDIQTMMMSGFIVDDTEDVMNDVANEEGSDEEDALFDSTCAFCDNGGELLCCDGRCLRSFHPTVEADNVCETLGLTKEEVDAIQEFFCKNCKYKLHQCYACGKLGSSDKDKGAEVFICASATCGHFYHPHCVAKLLYRDDEVAAVNLQKSIVQGGSFTCPLHKCHICKGGENKMDYALQFAVCRRCPKAYHRKCLPRTIAFEDNEKEGLIARAWEGLLPNNRILIYCLKHQIIDELGTPSRDHIKFPLTEEEKTVEELKKKPKPELPSCREKVGPMKSSSTSKDSFQGKSAEKTFTRLPSTMKQVETTKIKDRPSAVSDSSRKVKRTDASKNTVKKNMKYGSVGTERSSTVDAKIPSLGERLYAHMIEEAEHKKLGKRDTPNTELTKTAAVTPARKKLSSDLPALDADDERRLLTLMQDAASSITLEDVQKKYRMPSTHAYSLKTYVDKIKLGRVEGSVEAVQTALKKLEEENCSIEDAKALCPPEVLEQIFKWKNKLKVYLAPFFHGMRYTSFGRHFTKVEKLQDIVDRLHCYVKDDDMIVDFCCGANDFSCLMKKKLEATGKKCLYKNYDILPAKNDFNFEMKDWLKVKPRELAPGSRLIMGLNPPFGVKASLANSFINKALEFNPKLLILIVPTETERLDQKKSPYDLVWEDEQFLSGKSFYLPGSVDEDDKQIDQWNLVSPPLSLWSHPDWTAIHKAIAEKNGHISRDCKESNLAKNDIETSVIDQEMQDDFGHYGDTSMLTDLPLQNNEAEKLGPTPTKGQKESFPESDSERELHDGHGYWKNQSSKDARKRKRYNKSCESEMSGKSSGDKQSDGRHPGSEIYNAMPYNSPANVTDGRSSAEGHPSRSVEMRSHTGFVEQGYQHLESSMSGSHMQFRTACAETQSSVPGEMVWVSGTSGKSPAEEQGGGGRHQGSDIIKSRSSAEVRPSGYQYFERSTSGSHRTAFGGTQVSIPDEIERRSSVNNTDHFTSYKYSGGVNVAEQYMGRGRDNIDNRGYRSYIGDIGRESDVRLQFGYCGQDPVVSDPIFDQLGSLPSTTYGHFGLSLAVSNRINTSVMQRYTPQLHELNPPMSSNFRFEPPPPPMGDLNDFYDPRPSATSYPADPFATTPGPPHPYPHSGSSGGWVND